MALLQLALPYALPQWLRDWLESSELLGCGLELSETAEPRVDAAPGTGQGVSSKPGVLPRRMKVFGRGRLLDEALLFSPARELVHDGWFPIAGCGRRGLEVYFVNVRHTPGGKVGLLYVWAPDVGGLRPLNLTLDELASYERQDAAVLRLRMPGTVRRVRHDAAVPPPKATPNRCRQRRLSAAARTLPLFPT